MFNTDVIARLALAALVFQSPYAALTLPRSIPGQMRIVEGASSYPLFFAMAVLSFVIVLDVTANILCPHRRCRLRILVGIRENLYIGCAFCTVVPLFSVSKWSVVDPAANYLYLVIFSIALALAWCDATAKTGSHRASTS
jgi:hypothetical protein